MIDEARRHRWRSLPITLPPAALTQRPHRPAEVVAVQGEVAHLLLHLPVLREAVRLPYLPRITVAIRAVSMAVPRVARHRFRLLTPLLQSRRCVFILLGIPVTRRTRFAVTRPTAGSTIAGVVCMVLMTLGLMTSLGLSQDRPAATTQKKEQGIRRTHGSASRGRTAG